jgi:hypothetical protein
MRFDGVLLEERVMSSAEYREFADECMGWAKTAKSDGERESFLQMAHICLKAAARLERTRTLQSQEVAAA